MRSQSRDDDLMTISLVPARTRPWASESKKWHLCSENMATLPLTLVHPCLGFDAVLTTSRNDHVPVCRFIRYKMHVHAYAWAVSNAIILWQGWNNESSISRSLNNRDDNLQRTGIRGGNQQKIKHATTLLNAPSLKCSIAWRHWHLRVKVAPRHPC